MLMHPKDKIPIDQKKDVVYPWECQTDRWKSSYVGETSRALGKRVKEHCKSSTSAIMKHCTDHHHPLPSISNFNIINKGPSQEAKKAIHIQRLDPNLKRNIGKMSIPYCFDPLLGIKPKHPWVDLLSQAQEPVNEVAPPSQIPGLNLTQFHNTGTFRPNLVNQIPKHSELVGQKTYSIKFTTIGQLFITWHELSSVIPSSPNHQLNVWKHVFTHQT